MAVVVMTGQGGLVPVVQRHQGVPLDTAESAHLPIPEKQDEEKSGEGEAEQGGQQDDFHERTKKGWELKKMESTTVTT
ncbi:MAG: hypothetical protein KDM63_04660 [Verrucomicrobiae bacterium]|nr:hypothetical protein [Verrucomicrobiae bacterium]